MAALISFSLWWIWLSVSVLCSAASESKRDTEITAESGQKSITLKCRAPNNTNIMIVEWSRADLGDEYVLLYRNGRFDPDHQHPSFKKRVDLQDRQMKDGDVSLILKNVMTDDKGTYECRVFQRGTKRRKRANLNTDPISIINLRVDPPGQPVRHTEDGGKEDGSVGLKVGLPVGVFLLVVVVGAFVGCWIFRKHKPQNQDSHPPPAEPQIEMSDMPKLSFLNSESPAAEYNDRNDLEANNCHEQSTRIPDVTLTLENELLHHPPQETAGLLPESDIRVQ